jgi:hypothetical protein
MPASATSKVLVRTSDKMVFEIDSKTLDAKSVSCYDPYCFSDPEKGVQYVEYHDWICKRNVLRDL